MNRIIPRTGAAIVSITVFLSKQTEKPING